MSLIPEDFKSFFQIFKDNWQSIDLRVVAISKDVGWLFHTIQIIFDHDLKDRSVNEDIPNIDDLLVIHERWNIDEIEKLLEYVEKSELFVGDKKIHIKGYDGNVWKPLSSLNFRFYEKNEGYSRYNSNFPLAVLEGYHGGGLGFNEKKGINHKLRSEKIPWDGLVDLRANFVGIGPDWASRDDCFLSLVAPIYVQLKSAELDNSILTFEIEKADTINFEDISISLISHQENGIISRLKYHIKEMNTIIELDHAPLMIKLMVNYRNYIVDSKELFGHTLNRRINVYQQIFGDIQEFTEGFSIKGRQFEARISILFHLLGLSPAYYGFGAHDIPDILVFSKDDEFVLVIECTTREPDLNNKLTKLSTRAREIEGILHDIPVLPVLVTAFERSMINVSDVEKATKEQIALVTDDDISTLITMCLEQKSPKQIFNYLSSIIPFDASTYSRTYLIP